MKRICVLLVTVILSVLILSLPVLAETPPAEEWNKTFGGAYSDCGFYVQQTVDGGYIFVGTTSSFGSGYTDLWLIKTDANGDEEWNQTFGGEGFEGGNAVQQTDDGGYIIVGYTDYDTSGNYDIWLIKTDTDGNEVWNQTFGGSGIDRGRDVRQTTDGGYVIIGDTASYGHGMEDVWLIKVDAEGNEQWNREFGGWYYDVGKSVRQTSDSGYIIAGITTNTNSSNQDVWIIKTDTEGNEEWNQTFGDEMTDMAYSIEQTNDGGYIVGGATASTGAGSFDIWLIKIDGAGSEQWNKTFGGSDPDYGYSVRQTNDDGFIICGLTWSYAAGNEDVWLIKTDSAGNEQWNQAFGGSGYDRGQCVDELNDGGYIIVGTTTSFGSGSEDFWLIKLQGTDDGGENGKNQYHKKHGNKKQEKNNPDSKHNNHGNDNKNHNPSKGKK